MTLSAPEEGQPPTRTVGGARCHTVDRLRRYLLRVAPVGVWPGHVLTGLRRPADRTFEVRSHEGSALRICLRSRHPASVERPSLDRSAGSDTGERRRHRLERGAVGERLWRARPPCRVRWRPGRSPPRPGEGRATRAKPISGSGTEGRDRAWCRACRRAREGRCPTVRWTARRTVRSALAQPPRAPRPRPTAATAAQTVRGRRRRTRPPAVAGAASPSGCRPAGSATPPPTPPVSGPHRSPHTRTPPSCLLPRSKPSPLHPTKQADWGARGSQATPRDAGAKCGPSGSVATGLECEMSA